jgi:hypothetical protein
VVAFDQNASLLAGAFVEVPSAFTDAARATVATEFRAHDNGKGGSSLSKNNSEIGVNVSRDPSEIYSGPAASPSSDATASVSIPFSGSETKAHLHPSGSSGSWGGNFGGGGSLSNGTSGASSWNQWPSKTDVRNSGAGTHAVYGMRGAGNVFIYSANGVSATITLSGFTRPYGK